MSDVFEGVIGHEPQLNYLRTILQKSSLSHAYCFSGPDGLGKATIARRLAAGLLNTDLEKLPIHTDFMECLVPVDEKTGERKAAIPVEAIRDLRGQLRLSAFGTGMRVALIEDADIMTVAAQNALLKTLEEPRPNTLIILIATAPERLLQTILSRSVHLRFSRVPREQICEHLRTDGMARELAHEVAGLAGGRPGEAVRLSDNEAREALVEDLVAVEELFSVPVAQRIKTAESLVKQKGRQELVDVLDRWQLVAHDMLLEASGCGAWTARINTGASGSVKAYASILERIREASDSLRRNGSANLAIEHVIFNNS